MLSFDTEQLLGDFIKTIADNESLLEKERQYLTKIPPTSCFGCIDQYYLGHLTKNAVMIFLNHYCSSSFTEKEAENLIELATNSKKSSIYFDDFLRLIVPKDSAFSINLKHSLPLIELDKPMKQHLANLLGAILDNNNRLVPYYAKLEACLDYTTHEAFRTIVKSNSKFMCAADVGDFLERVHKGTRVDAVQFINALKKDMTKEDELSYNEFSEGLRLKFMMPLKKDSCYEEKHLDYRARYDTPEFKANYSPRLYEYTKKKETETYLTPKKDTAYETPNDKISTINTKGDYKTPGKIVSVKHEKSEKSIVKKLEYSQTKAPLKEELHVDVVSIMRMQIDYEKRLEELRRKLVQEEDFNLLEGFMLFDPTKKGYITVAEMNAGLKTLGVKSICYADLLFKHMDSDKDNKVRFSDYCKIVASKLKEYEQMLLKRPPYSDDKATQFTTLTMNIYRGFFELLLESEGALEDMKKKLDRKDVLDTFKAIDIDNEKYIYFGDVNIPFNLSCVSSWKRIK